MGTGANSWGYLFLLLSEGYEVRFSDYLSGQLSITVEIKKGYYNARWVITRDSLEKNMLEDNLLMYEILKKLREMVDAQAEKGESNDCKLIKVEE